MTTPAISIQLWTVRDALETDLDGTLAKLSSIGFTKVEAFGFVSRADELAAAFARHGISSPTGHASLASGTENPFDASITVPSAAEVFAAAKKLGMTTVIDPFVAPERWTSIEEITKTAEALNAAAALGAEHGITVGVPQPQSGVRQQDRRTLRARGLRRAARPPPSCSSSTCTGLPPAGQTSSHSWNVSAIAWSPCTSRTARSSRSHRGRAPHRSGSPPARGVVAADRSPGLDRHVQYAIIEFDAYSGDIWEGITTGYQFLTARGLA